MNRGLETRRFLPTSYDLSDVLVVIVGISLTFDTLARLMQQRGVRPAAGRVGFTVAIVAICWFGIVAGYHGVVDALYARYGSTGSRAAYLHRKIVAGVSVLCVIGRIAGTSIGGLAGDALSLPFLIWFPITNLVVLVGMVVIGRAGQKHPDGRTG